MSWFTLLGGGAIVSSITLFWSYIKLFFSICYGFFFVTIYIDDSNILTSKVPIFLMNRCKRVYESSFIVKHTWLGAPIYHWGSLNRKSFYWYNKTLLIVEKKEAWTIVFFRWFLNKEDLIKEIIDFNFICNWVGASNKKYYFDLIQGPGLYVNTQSYQSMGITSSSPVAGTQSQLDSLVDCQFLDQKYLISERPAISTSGTFYSLSSELIELEKQLKRWLNSQEWCKSHHVPWKYGVMLCGLPGGGKTSFIRYFAEKYDVPIIQFDLATFSNQSFTREWSVSSRREGPKIILFEDFDSVFNKRQNVSGQHQALTFDCVLSHIDGIEINSGVLLFITTNNPENIDSALATMENDKPIFRPGRINKVVHIGLASLEQKQEIARNIFRDEHKLIDFNIDETAASFHSRCIDIMSEQYFGVSYEN